MMYYALEWWYQPKVPTYHSRKSDFLCTHGLPWRHTFWIRKLWDCLITTEYNSENLSRIDPNVLKSGNTAWGVLTVAIERWWMTNGGDRESRYRLVEKKWHRNGQDRETATEQDYMIWNAPSWLIPKWLHELNILLKLWGKLKIAK